MSPGRVGTMDMAGLLFYVLGFLFWHIFAVAANMHSKPSLHHSMRLQPNTNRPNGISCVCNHSISFHRLRGRSQSFVHYSGPGAEEEAEGGREERKAGQ